MPWMIHAFELLEEDDESEEQIVMAEGRESLQIRTCFTISEHQQNWIHKQEKNN